MADELKAQSINDVEHSSGATGVSPAGHATVLNDSERRIELVPVAPS